MVLYRNLGFTPEACGMGRVKLWLCGTQKRMSQEELQEGSAQYYSVCFGSRAVMNKDRRARCQICCNSKARSEPSYEKKYRCKCVVFTSTNKSRVLTKKEKKTPLIVMLTNALTTIIQCNLAGYYHAHI